MSSTALWLALATVVFAIALLIASSALLVRVWNARESRERDDGAEAAEPPAEAPAAGDEVDELRLARDEARRARDFAALASTLDLEKLLEHVVEAAAVQCGADAAGILLRQRRAAPLVKTARLRQQELAPSLDERWDEGHARSLSMHYRYRRGAVPDDDPIRTGLLVPIVGAEDERIGTLAVYWRREREPLDREFSALEELARASARAIQNAQRFQEAHELAILDALTGLYNRRFFDEALAREVKRAHRYDRSLALLLLDLDGFKAVNDEIGHLGGDAVLGEVAERLRSVIRAADLPCRIGGDEFGVILPEASEVEARQLEERLRAALEGRPIGRAERLRCSGGVAELQRDDDSTSLFQRADQALFRAKRSKSEPRSFPDGFR